MFLLTLNYNFRVAIGIRKLGELTIKENQLNSVGNITWLTRVPLEEWKSPSIVLIHRYAATQSLYETLLRNKITKLTVLPKQRVFVSCLGFNCR